MQGPEYQNAIAHVDVDLLLSTLKSTDTQMGEWVNVIGYVENPITSHDRRGKLREKREVKVKAIILWSAGAVRLTEYEHALRDRLALDLT